MLTHKIEFPSVSMANKDGILAIGGDLSVERLLLAYHSGIFPWFNEREPIIWYAPNPRMVLYPVELKVSKSMRQLLKKKTYKVTYNTAFKKVINHCKNVVRKKQDGTWITNDMEKAYIELYKKGFAKSVEVWHNETLVGGLYGVDLGTVFCGESMFSLESNASKVAFVFLTQKLKSENYKLIDCQVYNSHLATLGAREISRVDFMKIIAEK